MLSKDNIKDIYTLTPMQEGMFFHAMLDKSSSAYFEQFFYRLTGHLDVDCVEKSLNQLMKRYDVLRTVFIRKNKKLLQVVLKDRKIDFYYENISTRRDKQDYLLEYKEKDKQRFFDLGRDVLIRAAVIQLGDSQYELIWSHHHIIMDGWCIGILTSELLEIYESFLDNRPCKLSPVTPYQVYIQWLEKQNKTTSRDFWQEYLQGYDEAVAIPSTTPPAMKGENYKKEQLNLVFDRQKTIGLIRTAEKKQVTLNTLIHAAWGIILGKYNNTRDVVFGAVVSGRPAEIERVDSMIGLFINTIPVRIQYSGRTTFFDLLGHVQHRAVQCQAHHYYPLAETQALSPLKQNLLDHILVFENYPVVQQINALFKTFAEIPGNIKFQLSSARLVEHSNYNFNMTMILEDQLTIKLEYNVNVHGREWVEKIAGHITHVVEQILAHQDSGAALRVEKITLLTDEEKSRILCDFNNTHVGYDWDILIKELFEAQVEKTPTAAAAIFNEKELSYSRLNEKANELAAGLTARGIKKNSLVPVLMDHSLELLISFLAIMKAGAAFVPVDVRWPLERVKGILSDLGTGTVLVNRETPFNEMELEKEPLMVHEPSIEGSGKNPDVTVESEDIIYVFYTSGTTGKPKGVVLPYRGVMNRLFWMNDYFGKESSVSVLHTTRYVYDSVVWQFFWPLINGGKTIITPGDLEITVTNLSALIKHYRVTIVDFVPSVFNILVDQLSKKEELKDRFQCLRDIVLGGEEIIPSAAYQFRELVPGVRITNLYGPTETTIGCIYHQVIGNEGTRIPIGKPISNVQVYILDRDGYPVPVGVAGEIFIAGKGLGLGYLNNFAKTSQVFFQGISVSKKKVYRTGDLARWLPDGSIDFLGRVDHQVKIRGYRIELSEIEHQLLNHGSIKEAVVMVKETAATEAAADGGSEGNQPRRSEKYLCAYIVPGTELEIPEIRRYLAEKLPNYMVPSRFIRLERIPWTPAGKIDRKALPEPMPEEFTAPRDEWEETLVDMWAAVLDREKDSIGIDDNFFQLGGHSLKATTLAAHIHKGLHLRLPLKQIFSTPTIRELAQYLQKLEKEKFLHINAAEEKQYYAVSSAQKRFFILQQMDPGSIGYNLPVTLILEGELQAKKLAETFQQLIHRHESLRTSFEMKQGQLIQRIHQQVSFAVEYHDISGEAGDRETRSRGIDAESAEITLIERFIRPFVLSHAPLFRVGLINVTHHKHILVLDMHHIITDGVSHDVLAKDFMWLYHGEKLPGIRLQYKDFAEWHNSKPTTNLLKRQEKYWQKVFETDISILNIPTDFPRPKIKSFAGDGVHFSIDKQEFKRLKTLALKENVTVYIVVAVVYLIFLSKLSGQEDIIIGTPVAGRRNADIQHIIGVFINTLALRNFPSPGKTVNLFLKETKERILMAYENQEYPFDQLVDKLSLRRDMARNPLFEVGFTLTKSEVPNGNVSNLEIPGLAMRPYNYRNKISKFDLGLYGLETEEELFFTFEYCTQLFKKETINKFIGYFKRILTEVLDDPLKKIANLEMVGQNQRSILVEKIRQENYGFLEVNRDSKDKFQADFDF